MRRAALRLIALIILLSGTADYLAFDIGDPLAPMSAAGTSSLIGPGTRHRMSQTTMRNTDTQDDGCIGCAAGFTAYQVEFPVAEVTATMSALPVFYPSDPQLVRVDPPPRG